MDRNSTPASSPPTGQKRAAAGSARSATPQQPIRTFRYNYYVNPAAEADSAAEEEANESKSRRRNLKKRARASQLKAGGLTSYRSALSRGEGPRRMARFDWTLGAFPRPLSAFSRSSTWALLHCLWYEHHIARDAELEAISGARSPWRSCWSDEGFARAWEELREGVDERVKGKMRLPVGGDGRGGLLMRKNLEWGSRGGCSRRRTRTVTRATTSTGWQRCSKNTRTFAPGSSSCGEESSFQGETGQSKF